MLRIDTYITKSMDMSLSKLWEIVKDREDWHAMASQIDGHNLATEQQQQCINMESRKLVPMNLFGRQQWRCRHREQPGGHSGGMRGWDE